jgi:glycosyltransferase involved in cell wall biosynthesis
MSALARPISESTFVLACNGAPDAPPATPVRDFLLRHGARRVTTVYHPLEPEDDPHHVITVFEQGESPKRRAIRLPSRPPYTYVVDPFIPLWPRAADCWIGFNSLAAARGLVQRRADRVAKVVYWAIDFVPDRFGKGLLTKAYDALDAACCRRVDARFEVSSAALEARNARHGLTAETMAPAEVAPMGAWLARVPVAPQDGWRRRRVLYLGHLVPRQGVGMLLEALAVLRRRDMELTAEIAGQGPLLKDLRRQTQELGLANDVAFVGFISDHRKLEDFVASGSVAVAPYDTTVHSFTRFADPSKVRAYMAGGVPVVLTDVPPNAAELAREGGAEIVPFTAEGIADGIERALSSPEEWVRRRRAALDYAARFDWEEIVERTLGFVGFAT